MSNKPKISVIIPSFQQGSYIGETLESVCSQPYPAKEIIVIDGGSTDETVDVIRRFESRLTYWESKKDSGQSEAINKGFKRATGDIFTWLNSDDRYTSGTLAKIGAMYSPGKTAFIGRLRTFKGDEYRTPGGRMLYETAEKTGGSSGMSQPAMFFSSSAYRELGLLNEQLHYCMDLEWWIKYLLRFGMSGIVTTNDILADFRLHVSSKTEKAQLAFIMERNSIFHALARLSGDNKAAEIIQSNENLLENYEFRLNMDEQMKQVAVKMVHYHFLQRGDEHYSSGERRAASIYLSAIRTEFFPPVDRKHLRGLKFRNRFIPSFIKKLVK